MPKRPTLGTIRFIGSPWPKGHAVRKFVWSGRLDPKTGVWFDLHLETADFDANDKSRDGDEDGDEDDDWKSKMVWENYGSAALSSTKWENEHTGFLVGTKKAPLDFSARGLAKKAFVVDPAPLPKKRAFGLYAIGHNTPGKHEIHFKPAGRGPSFESAAIEWSGKLSLGFDVHGKGARLDHAFAVTIPKATFEGFRVRDGVSVADARTAMASFVRSPMAFDFVKRKGKLWACLSR